WDRGDQMSVDEAYEKHISLIEKGLEIHEKRKYSKALPYFERALALSPNCPVAIYNKANVLHMLGRHSEAYPLLRDLIGTDARELRRRCPASGPRSLQLDAYYLLFQVVLYDRGFCDEAFAYAEEHLQRRKRGLKSLFSAREVRHEI